MIFKDVALVVIEELMQNGPLTHEQVISQALEKAFNAGMMHASVPRDRVSVHGTDDCMNCDTGRITLYAGSRWCIECQHKKEKAQMNQVPEHLAACKETNS